MTMDTLVVLLIVAGAAAFIVRRVLRTVARSRADAKAIATGSSAGCSSCGCSEAGRPASTR
jgi:hypothetical protein